MKIRTTIAVMAAKITGHVCKLMGRQGVTWAGKVAMKICPDILEELSSQVREKIFVVCGTNGKTTTNNMLCAGLEAEGKKVICNHTGSNMLNGVVAAFVLGAKFSGKLGFQFGFKVVINRRLHIFVGHDGCREQTYIVEHIRILLGDVHGVVTAHRQSGNGTTLLVGLRTVSLINELHHVGESSLERAFHRLGQIHAGSGKTQ